jgi:hypothetical protein
VPLLLVTRLALCMSSAPPAPNSMAQIYCSTAGYYSDCCSSRTCIIGVELCVTAQCYCFRKVVGDLTVLAGCLQHNINLKTRLRQVRLIILASVYQRMQWVCWQCHINDRGAVGTAYTSDGTVLLLCIGVCDS